MNLLVVCLFVVSFVKGANYQCQFEWTEILMSVTSLPYSSNSSTMFQYSGFKLNSLGNYDSCNSLPDAKYVVIGFSAVPLIVQTFCGPAVCTEQDYYDARYLIGEDAPEYLVVFPYEYQKTYYSGYSESAVKVVTLALVAVLIGFVAMIHYELFGAGGSFAGELTYLLSVKSNFVKLFECRSKDGGGESGLEFLNAVRVLSIGWVILGHTYLLNLVFPVVNNFDTAFGEISEARYILVYGAFYAVDTFFWLSGFLMAYIFLSDLEKSPRSSPKSILKVYLHRYIRVTPIYLFCLFFFWNMQKYLGSGPLHVFIDESFFGSCEDYWWTNPFYLNNFIPDYKGNDCFGVSWYLCVDMQLSLIGAILVYIYSKVKKSLGWVLIGLLCLISCLSSGVIASKYDMNVSAFSFHNRDDYMAYYYTKPYTRMAPYMLGIACAFIALSPKLSKEKPEHCDQFARIVEYGLDKVSVRVASFAIGLGLINVLIFAQYDTYKHPGKDFGFTHWSKKANYTFIAMERLTYGLGISLVFLPLLLGHFKPLARSLTGVGWNFVARLSFVMYLVHINVIGAILKSERDSITYRNYVNVRDSVYFTIVSMAVALPIVVFGEMPLANLEKFVRGRIELRSPQLLSNDESRVSKENEGIELA